MLAKQLLRLSEKSYLNIEKGAMWLIPGLGIPALRYFNDPKETRNQLFFRDLSTYVTGAIIAFVGGEAIERQLARFKPFENFRVRSLTALVSALSLYVLYSGIAAVKLSEKFAPQKAQPDKPPPSPDIKFGPRKKEDISSMSKVALPNGKKPMSQFSSHPPVRWSAKSTGKAPLHKPNTHLGPRLSTFPPPNYYPAFYSPLYR